MSTIEIRAGKGSSLAFLLNDAMRCSMVARYEYHLTYLIPWEPLPEFGVLITDDGEALEIVSVDAEEISSVERRARTVAATVVV